MNPDPSAPVIVGAAAITQHVDDPRAADDALTLMRRALEAAAFDAVDGAEGSARALLGQADVVMIPRGTWTAANPAPVVAPWSPSIHSIVADIGVLQQTLVSRACAMVASGAAEIVLVAGAEAKHRALRAQIAGIDVDAFDPLDAVPAHASVATGTPSERMTPEHEILTREEI